MSVLPNNNLNETKYLKESDIDGFELSGFEIDDILFENNRFVFIVRPVDNCPDKCTCGNDAFRVAYESTRTCMDIPIKKMATEIKITFSVWRCRQCGKNYNNLPGSIPVKRRLTSRAIEFVKSPLTSSKNNTVMGKEIGVNESTIRAIRKGKWDEPEEAIGVVC